MVTVSVASLTTVICAVLPSVVTSLVLPPATSTMWAFQVYGSTLASFSVMV